MLFSVAGGRAQDVSCPGLPRGRVLKTRSLPVAGKARYLVLVRDGRGCVFTDTRPLHNIDMSEATAD